jgi:hypothetical protein
MAKAKKGGSLRAGATKSTKSGAARAGASANGSAKGNGNAKAKGNRGANAEPKRASRPDPVVLTSEERRRMLKPRENYVEIIERVLRTWDANRELRVPGLTQAGLRKRLAAAQRAAEREQKLREQVERKLRTLADARLVAEHTMWRALLDLHGAAKLFGRTAPSIAQDFAFLTDALTNARAAEPEGEPVEKPEG